MGAGHQHHHHATTGARLVWGLVTTLAFVIGEALVGFMTGSLALVSDAGHNLADGLALGLAWYATVLAARRADARRTYGYHRVGVLAALVNAVVLVGIAGAIVWGATLRLHAPISVPGWPVIGTAVVALVVNLLISSWLSGGSHRDINVRAARLHMLADAASSAGVIIAGLLMLATGWTLVDPIASLLIAGLILWSSWAILVESVGILLEAAPPDLDMDRVVALIRGVPGVQGVHDLHAWSLGSGITACSCHIMVAEQSASAGQEVQRLVAEALGRFGISHTTIQLEVTPCGEEQGPYCVANATIDQHGHPQPAQGRDAHDHRHDHGHDHGDDEAPDAHAAGQAHDHQHGHADPADHDGHDHDHASPGHTHTPRSPPAHERGAPPPSGERRNESHGPGDTTPQRPSPSRSP